MDRVPVPRVKVGRCSRTARSNQTGSRAAVLDERAASLRNSLAFIVLLAARESEGSGFQRAIRACDVRAAGLQEARTKRDENRADFRHSRFVGSDEDGGSPANIASAASK